MVAGFVIGVDGGGTRSRAVAMSIEGERLGEVNGGPLNVNTTETGTFTESLDGLFQQFRDLHRLDASAAVQTVIGTASLFTKFISFHEGGFRAEATAGRSRIRLELHFVVGIFL